MEKKCKTDLRYLQRETDNDKKKLQVLSECCVLAVSTARSKFSEDGRFIVNIIIIIIIIIRHMLSVFHEAFQ
jgi:hypothetical protein